LIYFTVYDSEGNKIADCGNEIDAKRLAEYRKGTYKSNRMEWKETVTIEPLEPLRIPSIKIGGQEIPLQQKLPDTQQEPLEL
jgi:hypothetical protein